MTEKEFAESIGYLGLAYGKEFTQQELMLYYDFLKEYSDKTLIIAIKNIIRKSKFLPKITEILEECEKYKEQMVFGILDHMSQKGYFKAPIEYEKATLFMERGCVPEWLQRDINEYYRLINQATLEQKETLMIGGKHGR